MLKGEWNRSKVIVDRINTCPIEAAEYTFENNKESLLERLTASLHWRDGQSLDQNES